MEIAGKARQYLRQFPAALLHIDTIGVGAGVYDRLREFPDIADRVYGVNVAAAPYDTESFVNLRAESWENMRKWLLKAKLHPHKSWIEIAAPKYKINSQGKEQLESKDDMKKRGVKSPDLADALMLTIAQPTEGTLTAPVFISL